MKPYSEHVYAWLVSRQRAIQRAAELRDALGLPPVTELER